MTVYFFSLNSIMVYASVVGQHTSTTLSTNKGLLIAWLFCGNTNKGKDVAYAGVGLLLYKPLLLT